MQYTVYLFFHHIAYETYDKADVAWERNLLNAKLPFGCNSNCFFFRYRPAVNQQHNSVDDDIVDNFDWDSIC